MTQVMARCARCGRIAPAQVFLVDEYEYSGYGLTEPEGWWGVDYCGEPCVPGDTGRFHGPYREPKGSLNGALTDVSLLLGSAYVADKVFPVVPVTRTKDIYYKFTKGSKP